MGVFQLRSVSVGEFWKYSVCSPKSKSKKIPFDSFAIFRRMIDIFEKNNLN